jgi:hypothetical protein
MWREQAACVGADSELFAPLERHTDTEWAAIDYAANTYCTGCPALIECGQFADQDRLTGIYGGTYRRIKHGRYVTRVIADGAQAPQLTDRRSGVRNGWKVA